MRESIKDNFKRARILIVEDNDDQWAIIKRALARVLPEMAVVRVASLESVLSLLLEWERDDSVLPRLVLLDLYLPQSQQGFQVLDRLRDQSSSFKQLPVIMLSCSAVDSDILEAYRRGCSAYLIKPELFQDWLNFFIEVRRYWWETVHLPTLQHVL